MSSAQFAQVRALFEQLIGLPASEREAILAQAQTDVREEVLGLLAIESDGRKDPIAARIGDAAEQAIGEIGEAELPAHVGAYRVLGVLGEGGMGTVLLGERDDGEFRRQVAIKLIRGISSSSGRERLRRERQLLAKLDHPNIARLLDGGTTPAGEPYLVMEHVTGELLVDWLARARPALAARLDLFVALCKAVHFAHQHLIVHRDIKPGNVMVRGDDEPVLLDFGIAKLLDPGDSGEHTATAVMTIAFASPEQLLGRTVTTATDVFGLGLILYGLLAGGVPARGDALQAAHCVLPLPSKIAAQSAHAWLRDDARRLAGDLDKIARMATRSDPTARYGSAATLAADVESYLRGRPVLAAGQHWRYALGKFLRRNRYAVATVAAVLLLLFGVGIQLAIERTRARSAEANAVRQADTANAVVAFLVQLFAELDPARHPGREISARELLDRGRTQINQMSATPARVRARLEQSLGGIYANIGVNPAAIELLTQARATLLTHQDLGKDLVNTENALAHALDEAGRFDEALMVARAAVEHAQAALGADSADAGHALLALGVAQEYLAQHSAADANFQRAQAIFATFGDAERESQLSILHDRGWIAEHRGDWASALPMYTQAHKEKVKYIGEDHPKTLNSLSGVGKALRGLGRYPEAMDVFEELLQRRQRVHGERSKPVEAALYEVAEGHHDLGHYAQATQYYMQALELARLHARNDDDLIVALVLNMQGVLALDRGAPAEAERLCRSALDAQRRQRAEGHREIANSSACLARALLQKGELTSAGTLIADLARMRADEYVADSLERIEVGVLGAELAIAHGDSAAASAMLAPLRATIARRAQPCALLCTRVADADIAIAALRNDTPARLRAANAAVADAGAYLAPEHLKLALAKLNLAETQLASGTRAAASKSAQDAAEILRRELDPQAAALDRLRVLERELASG